MGLFTEKGLQLPIFVYGSLKQGFSNHELLDGRYENVEKAAIKGFKMYAVAGKSFPGIVRGDGEVFGELYWLKPETYFHTLTALDSLEGYNCTPKFMYLREKVKVFTDRGKCEAYVYIWNRPVNEDMLIDSGDWSTRENSLQSVLDELYTLYEKMLALYYNGHITKEELSLILNELEYVAGMLKK